jgi:signal peptidase
MSPAIRVGDVVVTSPLHASDAATLRRGSVVLAADPGHPGTALMHRVVDRNPDGTLVTQGDANLSRDSTPMPPDHLRGLARFRVPFIGIPVMRLRTGDPLPAIALTVIVIILASVRIPRPEIAGHRHRHRHRHRLRHRLHAGRRGRHTWPVVREQDLS